MPRHFPVGFSKPSGKSRGMKPKVVPNTIQNAFFQLSPIDGRKLKKHPWDRNWYEFRFHATAFSGGLFQAQRKKPALKPKVVQFRSQTRFFNFRPDRGEVEKTPLGSEFYEFRFNATIFRWAFPSPAENAGIETEIVIHYDSKRVFSTFAHRWAKVEKTPLDRIWYEFRFHATAFSGGLFQAQRKKPWHETEGRPIPIQNAFFQLSPRSGRKLKKRVLNGIGRPSSTRLFPLLGKGHPKWWHETEIVKFDPKGVFSFRPDGES